MTPPGSAEIYAVLDATWPPARILRHGPWTLREGQGGGQRVSATTAHSPVLETDIASAEAEMAKLGQRSLFMVRPEDTALDAWLAARGYQVVDPVTVYVSATKDLTASLSGTTTTTSWPPLQIQRDIWAQGGISDARIAVMERAKSTKTTVLGRIADAPAGVAYVAIHNNIAMLHALEVSKPFRQTGVGTIILHAAANWAQAQGAKWFTLIVTQANKPANALYTKLSMRPVAGYHYRRATEQPA